LIVRAHTLLRSRFVRVLSAIALSGTLVITGGSAAWAAKVKPTHHPAGGGGATGGGTSGGGITYTGGGIVDNTGSSQYGWVIPITFSYAPSSARTLSMASCPSSGVRNYASPVGYRASDGGSPVINQHLLYTVSGPAYIWGASTVLTNANGVGTLTVVPYGSGVVTVRAYWDLDGNGSWNSSFEPAAPPACAVWVG
jgi:hypothetical protein